MRYTDDVRHVEISELKANVELLDFDSIPLSRLDTRQTTKRLRDTVIVTEGSQKTDFLDIRSH